MIHEPRIEKGCLVYSCDGEGCESADGTHKIPLKEALVHIVSLVEELMSCGDPRMHSISVIAALFKSLAFGDSDISLEDEEEFSQEILKVRNLLDTYYAYRASALSRDPDSGIEFEVNSKGNTLLN